MMVAHNKKLDTLNFIETVKKFPEIFNTAHPGFKQQDDKSGAWHKIAEEFNTDPNVCKKKFRTLRERYTRELRRSYLEPNTPIKFDYFKQMSFLSPYIKFRSIMFETSEGKTFVTKREDPTDNKNELSGEIKILHSESYYEEDDQDQQNYVQETSGTSNIIYEASTGGEQITDSFSDTPQSHVHINDRQSEEDEILTTPISNNAGSSAKKDRKRRNSWNDVEEDDSGNKYFAMSVCCSLRRLSTINNLRAKGEIYEVLLKYASKENE